MHPDECGFIVPALLFILQGNARRAMSFVTDDEIKFRQIFQLLSLADDLN